MQYTHRIRRCAGNRLAWCLLALRDDGTEMDTHGGFATALSIDALLQHAKGLLPGADDVVQLIYDPIESAWLEADACYTRAADDAGWWGESKYHNAATHAPRLRYTWQARETARIAFEERQRYG